MNRNVGNPGNENGIMQPSTNNSFGENPDNNSSINYQEVQ